MTTTQPVPPSCLRMDWRSPAQTQHNVDAAAKLLACGASRRPDRMTDLLLEGPHGALRIEPVEWSRRCWHASVPLRWPQGCDSALWGRVLLAANSELIRHAAMAFALDADDAPVLMGRVYAGDEHGRERRIVRQLCALLEVCASIESVARAAAAAPMAYDALAAFIAPHARNDDDGDDGAEAPALLELLAEAGLPPEHACCVAASGKLPMGDGDVRIELAQGGRGLLLSAHLGHAVLDGQAVPVLRTNAELMRGHGLAVAHGAAGHRLVAHWPAGHRPPGEFEECLAALAGLPATLHDARTVRDPVDTDFSSLMPL